MLGLAACGVGSRTQKPDQRLGCNPWSSRQDINVPSGGGQADFEFVSDVRHDLVPIFDGSLCRFDTSQTVQAGAVIARTGAGTTTLMGWRMHFNNNGITLPDISEEAIRYFWGRNTDEKSVESSGGPETAAANCGPVFPFRWKIRICGSRYSVWTVPSSPALWPVPPAALMVPV